MSLISKMQALIDAANTRTGESDATLTDAVQTLVDGYAQGGGTNPLLYATSISFQDSPVGLPPNFTIELGSQINDLSALFNRAKFSPIAGSKLTVKANGTVTNLGNTFSAQGASAGGYEIIELDFDTSNVGSFYACFDSCSKLKRIIGVLDFSSATDVGDMFYYGSQLLEEIRLAANSLALSIDVGGSSVLSDASIISIANGLNETASGKTLTLHATPKSKCATILGNVAPDESNTYHIFTADASGTVTLENFITQTKGWTLA